MGRLVRLSLVERIHLAGYAVQDDGMDGRPVCFAAQEYANGENAVCLGGLLLESQRCFFQIWRTEACKPYTTATVIMHMPRLFKKLCNE